jgi:hypothetical protein
MVAKRENCIKSGRLAELKKHGFPGLFLVAGLPNLLNGVQEVVGSNPAGPNEV